MTTQIANTWNNLTKDEKLEIIENAIDMCNTNEGFLMLRYWSKNNSITGHIQNSLDNHLCVESVSKSTLLTLFGDDYDYNEEDASVILNWMENQK